MSHKLFGTKYFCCPDLIICMSKYLVKNLKIGKIRILTEELCQIEAVSENLFKERNIRKSCEIMTLFTVANGKEGNLIQGI